jgi:predicted AAA+ superfamily ATPase
MPWVDLAHWLLDHTGSLYSVNRLTAYLQSLGHKAPKASVSEYLQWFEDAYFLFTVRMFDASLARSHANPKKVYCVNGLVLSAPLRRPEPTFPSTGPYRNTPGAPPLT